MRWMSPELLALVQSGLENSRPTKQSDCYALGMVIYEVLSGQVPFASFNSHAVTQKVMGGERPQRPEGVLGAWFTDDIWRMLNRCWATQPEGRPSIMVVLECLDQVSREPPPLPAGEDVEMDEDDWNVGRDSSGDRSWSDPRWLVTLLHRILC